MSFDLQAAIAAQMSLVELHQSRAKVTPSQESAAALKEAIEGLAILQAMTGKTPADFSVPPVAAMPGDQEELPRLIDGLFASLTRQRLT